MVTGMAKPKTAGKPVYSAAKKAPKVKTGNLAAKAPNVRKGVAGSGK